MSTRKGIINVWVGVFSSVLGSLFQFILIFILLSNYGAEFNGFVKNCFALLSFVATAESGIGIMAAIFLFKPLMNKDWFECNEIINTTHRQNRFLGYVNIGILFLIIIIYNIFVFLVQDGISVISPSGSYNISFITSFVVMLSIGAKNIPALFWTSAQESLISADQNNHYRRIIYIMTDIVMYSFLFWGLSEKWNPIFPFLIFWIYSFVKSLFIRIFIKKRYPWLKIQKSNFNYKLVKSSISVNIIAIGEALLLYSDIIIVSLILGLKASSVLSFYMTIALGVRTVMILFISSFKEFFASWIAKSGRVQWNSYRKFQLYAYMIGAFTFVNQFISSPYFVNALYGPEIVEQIKSWSKNYQSTYREMFLKPTFSLLIAITSTLIVISEPNSVLIYAKNKYRTVAKFTLYLSIINIICSLALGIAFRATGQYVPSLFSIIAANTFFLAVRFVYLWVFAAWKLTYNFNLKGLLNNMLVLLIPIAAAITFVYIWLYPNGKYTYNSASHHLESSVISWTFIKLLRFFVIIFSSSAALILFVAFIFQPRNIIGLIKRFPIIYTIYLKLSNNKREHRIEKQKIQNFKPKLASGVEKELKSTSKESEASKEVYIIENK